MSRYQEEIPKHAGSLPYDASYRFDSHQDYLVNVSQGVVQDVFHLAGDVDAIRRKQVICMFLKMSDAPDEVAPEFLVLVWHGLTVCGPSSWFSLSMFLFVCLIVP